MSDIPEVNINIDGQKVSAPQGSMLIEAADAVGIHIPRFCYHNKLSIAANCRMCLVDMEGGRKPMPACATPVSEGMKVFTKNKKAIEYQKSVMEFLLINHPLDCPICDQGGECELQDISMGFGKDTTRYTQDRRSVEDHDLGPLISTELTRCIHCTRCVRFGDEIAGNRELGLTGRGEFAKIETFLNTNVDSEVSGNVIDICPVGALTSKPFRFRARAWEMEQRPFIATHDCLGSNAYAHVLRNKLLKVVPKECENINEVWLSDRDRFSYEGIYSSDRADSPMVKKSAEWEKQSWEDALESTVAILQKKLSSKGAEALCALTSSNISLEEGYLLQKLVREIGSNNIDFRQNQVDFSNQDQADLYPGLNCKISDIDNSDLVFVIGSNMRQEVPVLHLRLRKAWYQNGANICLLNPADYDYRMDLSENILVNYDEMPFALAQILYFVLKNIKSKNDSHAAKIKQIKKDCKLLLSDIKPLDKYKEISQKLLASENPVILSGDIASNHPSYNLIITLQKILLDLLDAKGGELTFGANAAGCWISGVLPHRSCAGNKLDNKLDKIGLNAGAMLEHDADKKVFILFNTDPVLDSRFGEAVLKDLQKATVIAITPFASENIKKYADVILPISVSAESSGTYVNASGNWQSYSAVINPQGDVRPGWKVLRVLANFLKLDGFDYVSSEEIKNQVEQEFNKYKKNEKSDIKSNIKSELDPIKKITQKGVKAIYQPGIYFQDFLSLRSKSLQATNLSKYHDRVRISRKQAGKIGVNTGDLVNFKLDKLDKLNINLPIVVDPSLPDLNIVFPVGSSKTKSWVKLNNLVILKKVK